MRGTGAALCMLLLGTSMCAARGCDVSATGAVRKLYPMDEWDADASLAQLRTRLQATVWKRDWTGLRDYLDPRIMNSFGGDGGVREFQKQWHPEHASSRLWPILRELISFGGCFTSPRRDEFWTPYIFARFPDTIDAFTHTVVVGGQVKLRAGPSESAKVVGTLSYDIVELQRTDHGRIDQTAAWVGVRVRTMEGYVQRTSVRSPLDYRLGLRKHSGMWRIVALIAGD